MTKNDPFTTYNIGKNCHTGNTELYREPNGGKLMIGGWNQGAHFDWNTHVIDLTGNERKFYEMPTAYDETSRQFLAFTGQLYAGWLSLPFPDFKTPQNLTTRAQWEGIAGIISNILKKGNDVLVACHGGHGRSGLFCAIVCYLLAVNKDRSWSSPVEKIRKLHCDDAVETLSQEKFVYDVLGLDIKITRTFVDATPAANWKYEKCPICGTQSTYVGDLGMCLGCEKKYAGLAPVKEYIVAADLKHKGEVDHACSNANCIGIWKAKECGHTVHNKLIIDGFCETCYNQIVEEQKYANKADNEVPGDEPTCAICQKSHGWYAQRFGICYECSNHLQASGAVEYVHNSITDPYRAVPHHCDDDFCVGIVVADVCGHVVHNRDVEDGICPDCKSMKTEAK